MYWRGTLSTRHVHTSPLRLMLGLTRELGIGSPESAPIPDFFAGNRGGNPRFPIWPGNTEGIPEARFGRDSRIGVPIRRAGDLLVWAGLTSFGKSYQEKKRSAKRPLGRAGTSHTTWFKRDLRPPALHTRPLLAHEGVASGPLRGPRGPRAGALPRVGREHARTARD